MNNEQSTPEKRAPTASSRHLRRLLAVLIGLAVVAAGVYVYWWQSRVTLEPVPNVEALPLEPRVRELIQVATAEVASQNRSAMAWGDLGAVFFAHDLRNEAAVCFRNAERLEPADYRWPYLLGVCYMIDDKEQALACYQRAAQRCGDRPAVHLRLAETLLDRGELEAAAAPIETVLSRDSSNARGQLAKARLLFAQGNLAEAKTWAHRSALAAADKRAPHLLLAQLCRRTQDAQGEELALAALERIPDGFTPWEDPDIATIGELKQDRLTRLTRAERLAASGESAKATRMFAELASGSDGGTAAVQLAQSYRQAGRIREAELLLRMQIQDFPGDERLHFLLGAACFQQENWKDAEKEFRRVLEIKPDYVDAWFNLGIALVQLGKRDDARAAFAATVRLSPGSVYARINLAELLLAEGKSEEAREHLEAALKLAPEEPRARELLAKAKSAEK